MQIHPHPETLSKSKTGSAGGPGSVLTLVAWTLTHTGWALWGPRDEPARGSAVEGWHVTEGLTFAATESHCGEMRIHKKLGWIRQH